MLVANQLNMDISNSIKLYLTGKFSIHYLNEPIYYFHLTTAVLSFKKGNVRRCVTTTMYFVVNCGNHFRIFRKTRSRINSLNVRMRRKLIDNVNQ